LTSLRSEFSIPIQDRKEGLMRILLLTAVTVLLTITIVSAGDIRLENSSFNTLAYIKDSGRIENASFEILGYIRDDGRIEDNSFHTLGYINEDGRIEDSSFNELFTITRNGRLTNSRFMMIAEIQSDGTVEDDCFHVILYADGSHENMTRRIAVFLVFFSDLLED
jgi:hypothetical protein